MWDPSLFKTTPWLFIFTGRHYCIAGPSQCRQAKTLLETLQTTWHGSKYRFRFSNVYVALPMLPLIHDGFQLHSPHINSNVIPAFLSLFSLHFVVYSKLPAAPKGMKDSNLEDVASAANLGSIFYLWAWCHNNKYLLPFSGSTYFPEASRGHHRPIPRFCRTLGVTQLGARCRVTVGISLSTTRQLSIPAHALILYLIHM